MINNIDTLEERIRIIGDEKLHDLSYENAMAIGFLVTYTSEIGNDPFAMFDVEESKQAFREMREYIQQEINKVNSLFDDIKDGLDDGEEPVSDDMVVEYCVENIMQYWDNGRKLEGLYYHLEKDNFHKIRDYDDYKQQIEKYNDLSELDNAFERYWDDMPHEIIDNVFDHRSY